MSEAREYLELEFRNLTQHDSPKGKFLKRALADVDGLLLRTQRGREAAQILIDEIGASGPESVYTTAERAVADIIRMKRDLNQSIEEIDDLKGQLPKEGTFEWALLQMREGHRAGRKGWDKGVYWSLAERRAYAPVTWSDLWATDWELYEPEIARCPICKDDQLRVVVYADGAQP